jgi:hypothetical protein
MKPWEVIAKVTDSLKMTRFVIALLPNMVSRFSENLPEFKFNLMIQTQVVTFTNTIYEQKLPFFVDRTIEVSHRNWDIEYPFKAHPYFR